MDLIALPAFAEPATFHVVIECPRGSTVKWKYEPKWNAMTISRPLALGVSYPCDWGFIPSTRAGDGDPLDALVVWDATSYPGVVLPCRAVGVMEVEQNRVNHDPSQRIRNDRIVAVPAGVRRENVPSTLEDLGPRLRQELEHFASIATAFEGKDVRVLGWGDAKAALTLLSGAVPQNVR